MKRYFTDTLLCCILAAITCSCCGALDEGGCGARQSIVLDCGRIETKAANADEDAVWDINLYIFGEGGLLEDHKYIRYPSPMYGKIHLAADLIMHREYTVAAFANAGYDMGTMNLDDFKGSSYHLPRPDSFTHGMPMLGKVMKYKPSQESESLNINIGHG